MKYLFHGTGEPTHWWMRSRLFLALLALGRVLPLQAALLEEGRYEQFNALSGVHSHIDVWDAARNEFSFSYESHTADGASCRVDGRARGIYLQNHERAEWRDTNGRCRLQLQRTRNFLVVSDVGGQCRLVYCKGKAFIGIDRFVLENVASLDALEVPSWHLGDDLCSDNVAMPEEGLHLLIEGWGALNPAYADELVGGRGGNTFHMRDALLVSRSCWPEPTTQ